MNTAEYPVMEDCERIHSLSQPFYQKQTGKLAYVETFWDTELPLKEQSFRQKIHLLDPLTLCDASITAGGHNETAPAILSDGTVLFLSNACVTTPLPEPGEFEERRINEYFRTPQLYACQNSRIRQLTHMRHGIISYQISPDESRVIFSSYLYQGDTLPDLTVEMTDESRRRELHALKYEPIICESPSFKSDAELGYKSIRSETLWLLDLKNESVHLIADDHQSFREPFWKDQTSILYTAVSKKGQMEFRQINLDRILPSADDPCIRQEQNSLPYTVFASLKNVIPSLEPLGHAQFSADGKYLVFAAFRPDSAYADPRELFAIPAEGGLDLQARCLIDPAQNIDGVGPQCYHFAGRSAGTSAFSVMPDGFCYYPTAINASLNLCKVPISPEEADASPICVIGGVQNFGSLIAGPDEHTLFALWSDDLHFPELVRIDTCTADITLLTDCNPWLSEIHLQKPEEISVITLDASERIQGFVIPPVYRTEANSEQPAEPAEKYPAILYIHGGPTGFYTTGLDLEFQALAAAGFAVIYANPRGGTGYGKEHSQDHFAYDGTAMNDLHQIVLEACDRYDFIDRERLGVCGGSYGGYMTAWIAGHSRLFKAACAHRPLLNFQMILASSHSAGQMHSREEHESYEDFIQSMIKESPTTYAEQIRIPIQILQSEKDANCVPEQAHQFYTAIKDLHPDLPCQLVLYPDSNHALLINGPMYLASLHRQDNLNWFRKYL